MPDSICFNNKKHASPHGGRDVCNIRAFCLTLHYLVHTVSARTPHTPHTQHTKHTKAYAIDKPTNKPIAIMIKKIIAIAALGRLAGHSIKELIESTARILLYEI